MDDKIAEVGANGTVLGLNPGTAIVKVKDGLGDLETVKVIVKPLETTAATVVSGVTTATTPKVTYAELVVSPKEITIDVNEDAKINVTGGDNNYTFKSNDDSIAEVGSNGTVVGIKPGETVITVTDGAGNKASVKVTVNKPAETTAATTGDKPVVTTTKITYADLVVTPDVIQLKPNESQKINVSGGDGNYTITSKDPEIAEAGNNGMVTGYKPGETVVKVTDGLGNMVTVKVIVLQPETTAATTVATTAATTVATTAATTITYAPLVVNPKSTEIDVADEFTIDVTGGDGNYTFKSNNEEAVKVDTTGKVIAYAPGDAIVTVTDGKGASAIVKVTVRQPETTAATTVATTTVATTAATTAATTVATTVATTPAAVVTTAANNNPTINPDSIPKADSAAAYFFSVEDNFQRLTDALKFTGVTNPQVTYQFGGKAVAGPKDVFVKGTHKYDLTVLANGKVAGTATVYIGVKGDANLDDEVDSKDAVAILKTFAYAITGTDLALQSDATLENLATFLADIDGETFDHKNLDSKDAVWILQFFAYSIAHDGQTQPWSELCKILADKGKKY